MKKLLRILAMGGAFAVAAGTVASLATPTDALAQVATKAAPAVVKPADPKETKVDPKDPKKPAASTAKGMVVIKPDAKGRFRISIKEDDGKDVKTLLMSAGNGFETEKEAREAIEDIKAILSTAKITVEKPEPSKDKEKDK